MASLREAVAEALGTVSYFEIIAFSYNAAGFLMLEQLIVHDPRNVRQKSISMYYPSDQSPPSRTMNKPSYILAVCGLLRSD